MKKILIPTDFTVTSLNLVRETIEKINEEKCLITLVHGIALSSSITDMLFFSRRNLLNELTNKEFESAVHVLYNKYQSKIERIQVDLLYSDNINYLNNYLEANEIDKIYLPETDSLSYCHKRSINLIPKLRKVLTSHENVNWANETTANNFENSIGALFFRNA